MREHPEAIGDNTTLAIMCALYAAGYSIFLPFGENTRYDLVIDDGSELKRVQCKTGRMKSGAIQFNTCRSYVHHPIDDMPTTRKASLRVEPSRNNQRLRVRPAAGYDVGRVDVRPTARPAAKPGASAPSA